MKFSPCLDNERGPTLVFTQQFGRCYEYIFIPVPPKANVCLSGILKYLRLLMISDLKRLDVSHRSPTCYRGREAEHYTLHNKKNSADFPTHIRGTGRQEWNRKDYKYNVCSAIGERSCGH